MTSLVPRDDRPPAPARVVYATYPLAPPPAPSISDAAGVVQRVLDIVARFGDELQDAVRAPYLCAVCPAEQPTDMARWPDWQRRRHFLSHPFMDRVRVVGWLRAVNP